MLNLFIAIIVNTMQNYSDEVRSVAIQASDLARAHVGAEVYAEFCAIREEMRQPHGELGYLRHDARAVEKAVRT